VHAVPGGGVALFDAMDDPIFADIHPTVWRVSDELGGVVRLRILSKLQNL
jgi:hypothetical protein